MPSSDTPSDDCLLARFAAGDRHALEELFRRYRAVAYRVAYRLLGNEADALDAVQDGFVKALSRLGIPFRLVEIDILKGESRTPEFLAKNPNGQVPLLEVAPGRYLAESNAILWNLVSGSRLRPGPSCRSMVASSTFIVRRGARSSILRRGSIPIFGR